MTPLQQRFNEAKGAIACESIAIEMMGEFAEWIASIDFKRYKEGWCQAGGSNGWHCTTTELIQKFLNSKMG